MEAIEAYFKIDRDIYRQILGDFDGGNNDWGGIVFGFS
jgi:hypothetical protein